MKNITQYHKKSYLKNYDAKTNEHWACLYPGLLASIKTIRGKKILDIGCGNGVITNYFAEKGAKESVGVDVSKEQIDLCLNSFPKKKNLSFIVEDGASLKRFKNSYFDIVVINMVLLNVDKESGVSKIINESSRVLKKNGELIFSDLHPLCIMGENMPTRKQLYSKGFRYIKNGAVYATQVNLVDGGSIEFTNRHWTLEYYFKILNKAGFYVYNILEPGYVSSAPKKLKLYKIPEYIFFHCKKFSSK